MRLFAPKERLTHETRAAMDPASVKKLSALGIDVRVETGLGAKAGHEDAAYTAAGAAVVTAQDADSAIAAADVVVRVHPPMPEEFGRMQQGAFHISFLDPFNHPELLQAAAAARIGAISLEMIPRTTLAQKMDVLSSQANLAGYESVILAASRLNRILPMMMTPAGTLSPARVFVIGVGVAGLQAIATARRLGARVEAFDTRPVVEEQVKSLGAKFIRIDLGETGQTAQGYATELSAEQLQKQRDGMAKVCAQSDIVITTAKLFGKKAPTLLTAAMIAGMRPGSVIVDLAAEAGGNVEGTRAGEEVVTDAGVVILGYANLEGRAAQHATQMFAANVANFIEHFYDAPTRTMRRSLDDDILKGCLLTHDGGIVHERFRS